MKYYLFLFNNIENFPPPPTPPPPGFPIDSVNATILVLITISTCIYFIYKSKMNKVDK
jgi:hypothetical protein